MLRKTILLSFLCFLYASTWSIFGASRKQEFTIMAQSYWNQLQINGSYKNQEHLIQLADYLQNASQDLAQEKASLDAHIALQKQDTAINPGTFSNLAAALQTATTKLEIAQAKHPANTKKIAQLAAELAKADENITYKNVYEARVVLQKTLCDNQDFTPLKTAIAQTKAILNPNDEELQDAAIKASKDRKRAEMALKEAEETLNAQWKIFQQKTIATQKAQSSLRQ
jgi:hypothetical protein